MLQRRVLLVVAGVLLLAACSSQEIILAHAVKLAPAVQPIPDDLLLDVGVVTFVSGASDAKAAPEVKRELMQAGTFVQLRRTESIYLAVQLRKTLQRSGQWGEVWVLPKATSTPELTVTTRILQSDGAFFRVHAEAVDATGRTWLNKDYELETAAGVYDGQRFPGLDPYQDVFNEISNDLAAEGRRLTPDERRDIRQVAAMRFAVDLSPEAFSGYVAKEHGGRYALNRLPAVGDPMFARTESVRRREMVFMDTLDGHYSRFAADARKHYDAWRQSAREESLAIQDARKAARWRTGMGVLALVTSAVYGGGMGGNSLAADVLTNTLMYVGADMLNSAAVRRREMKVHSDSLEELSSSFNKAVSPLVVDIQGTQHRLTGTVEVQYDEWRDLLKRMFDGETALPTAVDASPAPLLP